MAVSFVRDLRKRGCAQRLGVDGLQAAGRRFKSARPHQNASDLLLYALVMQGRFRRAQRSRADNCASSCPGIRSLQAGNLSPRRSPRTPSARRSSSPTSALTPASSTRPSCAGRTSRSIGELAATRRPTAALPCAFRAVGPDEARRLLATCDGRSFAERRDNAIIRLFPRQRHATGRARGPHGRPQLETNVAVMLCNGRRPRSCPYSSKTAMALDRYLRMRRRSRTTTTTIWATSKCG